MNNRSDSSEVKIKSRQGIKIFVAGDSTAADKQPDKRPETGWGQVIGRFFNEDVQIRNYAINGRSSKSFVDEGNLKEIAAEIGENDYLFIQFGHNDEKDVVELHTDPQRTFKQCLAEYVTCARIAKAFPVLLTPVQRRFFNEQGGIVNTHGQYPAAMRELAREMQVPLLDLSEVSKNFFESLGDEESKRIFLWLKPGESPNYPEGVQDNTHFCEYGAIEIARLIIEEIRKVDGLKDLTLRFKK